MSKQQANTTIHGTRGKGKWVMVEEIEEGYTKITGYQGWQIDYEIKLTQVSAEMLAKTVAMCVGG